MGSDETFIRMFAKLDDLSERMARVETKIDGHNKYAESLEQDIRQVKGSLSDHGKRIGNLEQAKAGATSLKEFIAWGVAIAATVWGVIK